MRGQRQRGRSSMSSTEAGGRSPPLGVTLGAILASNWPAAINALDRDIADQQV